MPAEPMSSRVRALTGEIELLRSFKPHAALRSSLEWRFPGTHGIGPFVPLHGLTGYTDQVARDIVDEAAGGLGLRFSDAQIAAFGDRLADLADLIDQTIAARLNWLYRSAAQQLSVSQLLR